MGAGGFDDITFQPDGNLLAEFLYMERLWRFSAVSDTYDDYTCGVLAMPQLECLDISGLNTLSASNLGSLVPDTGTVDRSPNENIYDPETNVFIALVSGGDASDTATAFGDTRTCTYDGYSTSADVTIGDGHVGAFDIAVLLWYQYGIAPYDNLTSSAHLLPTVSAREGTALRCNFTGEYDQHTRSDWVSTVAGDYCTSGEGLTTRVAPPAPPPSTGRRLLHADQSNQAVVQIKEIKADAKDATNTMNVSLSPWLETSIGTWFLISMPGVQTTFELFLGGALVVGVERAEFSSQLPPSQSCTSFCDPHSEMNDENLGKPQLRFLRRMEKTVFYRGVGEDNDDYDYDDDDDDAVSTAINVTTSAKKARAIRGCATIESGFADGDALYKGTVSLRQTPALRSCSFDVFLFLPHSTPSSEEERLCALPGSHAQGTEFTLLESKTCVPASLPPPLPSLPPSPPAPPAPPSSPPTEEKKLSFGAVTGIVVGASLAAFVLCAAVWQYF